MAKRPHPGLSAYTVVLLGLFLVGCNGGSIEEGPAPQRWNLPEVVLDADGRPDPSILALAQILNLLLDLQHELGLTYLFISHDLSVINFIADHVGVMCEGRLIEYGTAEQIYQDPQQAYTRKLLAAIPR